MRVIRLSFSDFKQLRFMQRYVIFFLWFVFALCERTSEHRYNEKYLAAAGAKAFNREIAYVLP